MVPKKTSFCFICFNGRPTSLIAVVLGGGGDKYTAAALWTWTDTPSATPWPLKAHPCLPLLAGDDQHPCEVRHRYQTAGGGGGRRGQQLLHKHGAGHLCATVAATHGVEGGGTDHGVGRCLVGPRPTCRKPWHACACRIPKYKNLKWF